MDRFRVILPIKLHVDVFDDKLAEMGIGDTETFETTTDATFFKIDAVYPDKEENGEDTGETIVVVGGTEFVVPLGEKEVMSRIEKAEVASFFITNKN